MHVRGLETTHASIIPRHRARTCRGSIDPKQATNRLAAAARQSPISPASRGFQGECSPPAGRIAYVRGNSNDRHVKTRSSNRLERWPLAIATSRRSSFIGTQILHPARHTILQRNYIRGENARTDRDEDTDKNTDTNTDINTHTHTPTLKHTLRRMTAWLHMTHVA